MTFDSTSFVSQEYAISYRECYEYRRGLGSDDIPVGSLNACYMVSEILD